MKIINRTLAGIFGIMCLITPYNLIAQKKTTPFAVTQQDSRLHIGMEYQIEDNNLLGGFSQDYRITVRNKTNDKLHIYIEYYAETVCGKRRTSQFAPLGDGYIMQPNESVNPTWDGKHQFGYQRLLGDECPKSTWRQTGTDKNGVKTYSIINSLGYRIVKIINLSEQERKIAEAKKQKEETENKKKEEEQKKRLIEEKAKQEAAKQRVAENKGKQTAINHSQNNSTAREITTTGTSSYAETARKDFVLGNIYVEQYRGYPEEFKTSDGKYIKKDNGHLVYISEQEYNQRKNDQRAALELRGEQARAKLQEEQNRKAQATIDNIRKQEQESIARKERSDAYMQQASYYGAQASYAKEMRIESSSFQKIHTDLASLEAEYSAKLSQLSEAAEVELQATSASYASAASSIAEAGWGNSAISQSAGEFGAALGGLIASNRANKARKELAEQRKEQAQAIAKAKKAHEEAERMLKAEAERLRKEGIISLRQQLAKTFIDGGPPLQKHNIKQPEVYLFAYSSAKSNWNSALSASILVSNIIPIYKMSDDTFPYKNAILKTLNALGEPNSITLIGFFTDKAEVEKIRSNFIASIEKAEFTVKSVQIKVEEKKNTIHQTLNKQDFWETGQTLINTEQEISQQGFWN